MENLLIQKKIIQCGKGPVPKYTHDTKVIPLIRILVTVLEFTTMRCLIIIMSILEPFCLAPHNYYGLIRFKQNTNLMSPDDRAVQLHAQIVG